MGEVWRRGGDGLREAWGWRLMIWEETDWIIGGIVDQRGMETAVF